MWNDEIDQTLFAGFASLAPTSEASHRVIDRIRALLLEASAGESGHLAQTSARRSSQWRLLACCGTAVVMALIACLAAQDRFQRKQEVRDLSATGETKTGGEPDGQTSDLPDIAAMIIPIIHLEVADSAAVLIANGGTKPIALGSKTVDAGGILHVWEWSKGNTSRPIPGFEFWGNENAILSPDGKQLVFAKGRILDLQTGKWSDIDLGGADTVIGSSTYSRIGDMRFSPDGSRLAMIITNISKDVPGQIDSEFAQVVEFPSGRELCHFPAGEHYALRIGFSADGKQLASADLDRVVSKRDSSTGQILRTYQPPLNSQLMGIAISPDGKYVAALQRDPGDLFIWEADTGRLLHHVKGNDLQEHGAHDPVYGTLRFSPDGKHLAAGYFGRLFVFDPATGTMEATLKEDLATAIQWSADSQVLATVTPVSIGKPTPKGHVNYYPSVHHWDWRSGKQIDASKAP